MRHHTGRTKTLIATARRLLQEELAIPEIDAIFAFDFDAEWNRRVEQLRLSCFGQAYPLDRENEGDWAYGCMIWIGSDEAWQGRTIYPGDDEAGFVALNKRIEQLAKWYSLDVRSVRDAILWGATPKIQFTERKYIFSEWRTGKAAHIRLEPWNPVIWMPQTDSTEILMRPPAPKKDRPPDWRIRIRTWTVYRLSRRGGGRLTEFDAIALWNRTFPTLALGVTSEPSGSSRVRGQRVRQDNYSHQRDDLLGKKQIESFEQWSASLGSPP